MCPDIKSLILFKILKAYRLYLVLFRVLVEGLYEFVSSHWLKHTVCRHRLAVQRVFHIRRIIKEGLHLGCRMVTDCFELFNICLHDNVSVDLLFIQHIFQLLTVPLQIRKA